MISFIVIGRNEGERLEKCFASIFSVINKDSIIDYEVIYVDSQSTDNSLLVAKKFENVRSYKILSKYNAAVARNIGAIVSNGETMFFIDGDMEIYSGFLPHVLKHGELTYPFISGIFDDYNYNEFWEFQSKSRRHKLNENDKDSFEFVTGGLFLVSRTIWDKVGGMDNRFKRSQDFDFGLRVAKQGIPLCRKAILLAKHHMIRYELRKDNLSYVKYSSLLLRKNIFNMQYLKIFLLQQYTTILFVLLILNCNGYLFLPSLTLYLVSILYKVRKYKSNRLISIINCNIKDILFLFTFLFFYPSQIKEKFIKI